MLEQVMVEGNRIGEVKKATCCNSCSRVRARTRNVSERGLACCAVTMAMHSPAVLKRVPMDFVSLATVLTYLDPVDADQATRVAKDGHCCRKLYCHTWARQHMCDIGAGDAQSVYGQRRRRRRAMIETRRWYYCRY